MSWREHVRRVTPYTPGEQPKESGIIKLNTNENPYPPAPGVEKVLRGLDGDLLRLYPDPAVTDLTEALAKRYGLSKEEVFVGVGSDDVLAMSFLTFFDGKEKILFPDITYSFYDVWAKLFRIPYACPKLSERFEIRPEDYLVPNGGIVIANPNAPTGAFLALSEIERIVAGNPDSVVIVDEAYVDFGGSSCLPLIRKYENLLVVQTFSKSRSLAGMRIGYAFGSRELIACLNDVKYSFNSYTMDRTAILAGVEAVKDEDYFQSCCKKIMDTRAWTQAELAKLGFVFVPSSTNFIFASHPACPAKELFEALRARKIFVRYFDRERIDNYLRITVGTDEEMRELISFLRSYLNGKERKN